VAHGLAVGEENTHLDRGWRCIGEACPLSADGMSPDGEEKCESVKHGDLWKQKRHRKREEGDGGEIGAHVCVCVCKLVMMMATLPYSLSQQTFGSKRAAR
jgi:hypothetical protein